MSMSDNKEKEKHRKKKSSQHGGKNREHRKKKGGQHKSKSGHQHEKKSKGGHHKTRPPRVARMNPAPEENLGGIVLVKNQKGRRNKAPNRSPAAMTPVGMPARTPQDLQEMMKAYRSVEPINTQTTPAELARGKIGAGRRNVLAAGDAEKKQIDTPRTPPIENKLSEEPVRDLVPRTQPLPPAPPPPAEDIPMAQTPPQQPPTLLPAPQRILIKDIETTPPKKAKENKDNGKKAGNNSSAETSNDDLTKREELATKEKPLTPEEKLKKFRTYAEKLLDGGMEFINKEFRFCRAYIPSAATRVAFDSNPRDNRFEDIVCIDHTRVALKDMAESYIHANWVTINKNRKMILTQLPLPQTSSSFWQMIIESEAQAILLLVTNYEMATFHGESTFPDQQDFLHFEDRHIRVGEFKRVKVGNHWSLHVLSISNGDKRRYLHVHQYSGWCHGHELKSHMDLQKIHSTFKRYKDPHVVVSLSGCGRAGTYAAFDLAHDRLHSDACDRVSVSDCVQRVRNGRMHAVQRPVQMKTIHLALGEHVLNNGFMKEMTGKQKDTWQDLLNGDSSK